MRTAPSHLDILYRVERGSYEPYDPARHGLWQILKDDRGRFYIHREGAIDDLPAAVPSEIEPADPTFDSASTFSAEYHLRDYLAANLHVIETGLMPYGDEEGSGFVEFRTPIGNIDILAIDAQGGLLVIELKVDRSSDAVAGQVLRYVNWVRRHIANGRSVRGLVIAKSISERLLYSIDADPTIEAREYRLHVEIAPPTKQLPV